MFCGAKSSDVCVFANVKKKLTDEVLEWHLAKVGERETVAKVHRHTATEERACLTVSTIEESAFVDDGFNVLLVDEVPTRGVADGAVNEERVHEWWCFRYRVV
jgi:hypothetical protein